MRLLPATWRRLAYVHVLLLSVWVGYALIHLPFEVGDCLANLLQLQEAASPLEVFRDVVTRDASSSAPGFLRPASWATTKMVFDLSGGHYFFTYRALHIVLVALLLALLVQLVQVGSGQACGLAILSSAALIGLHPFHEAVRETELNIKLIIPVCCCGVLALSASRPRWWKDVVALALVVYALLAIEIGILTWVCLAVGYVVGYRGVSRRAVLAASALLGLYFYLRFFQWNIGGAPPLTERSAGFGFAARDPAELIAMFGNNPLPFYAYNIVASAMTVLFSEPRSGVFYFIRDLLGSGVEMGVLIEIAASTLTTLVMVWFAARRWRNWLRGDLGNGDRLFLVSAAVLAGNAAISFPYTKDVTMSTAGVFYAIGMFAALEFWLSEVAGRRLSLWKGAAACLLIAAISLGWTIRAAGFFDDLRRTAYKAQNDWAVVHEWLRSQDVTVRSPEGWRLVEDQRRQMLAMDVPRVYLEPRWLQHLLDPRH